MKKAIDFLHTKVIVKIDRQLGTKHPKHTWEYPVNYGYISDTLAPDGEEIDAYVLGVDKPVDSFEGYCIAIIHRADDDDDKLVVVPEEKKNMSDNEIENLTYFQEQWFESTITRGKMT